MNTDIRLDERLNEGSGVYFDAAAKIVSVQSPFQLIEVFQTPELGKLMRIDGCNMLSERDEFFYHENFIHPAAITHAQPATALIIGGGDGGSAEELLKHPSIERLVLCELDAAVIEIANMHFASAHRGVFANPNLTVNIGDGLSYLQNTKQQFDLIYLDLTDPAGAAAALYTPAFYADCKRALNTGGALTLHLGSPFSHPARVKNSLKNLRQVFNIATPYFVHIPAYGAVWGFAVASDSLNIANLSTSEIDLRITERNLRDRQFYNGAMHHAILALPEYIQNLFA